MNLNKFLKISISFFLIVFLFSISYFLFFDIVLAINPIPQEITKDTIKTYYPDAPDEITEDQLDEFNKMSSIKFTEEQREAYNSGGSIKLTDEQRDAAWNAIEAEETVGVGQKKTTQEIVDKATKVDIACSKYNYPWCNNKPTGIADLVGKFYGYALAAAGVAALGAIIYGGILWTMSGAVSNQTEAKEWITAAVSGLALLLFAALLLNTINPELTKLTDPSKLIKEQKIKKENSIDYEKLIEKNKKIEETGKSCAEIKDREVCNADSNCQWGNTCTLNPQYQSK